VGALTPSALASLIGLVEAGAISGDAGRKVLELLVEEGGDPAALVEREGLGAMGDEVGEIVDRVLADHPDVVERIKGGNPKAIGALIGPIMRETKGRADGGEVQRLIREKLATDE
jgi:aspartyl-tRNA(Asn)/glutamyl-tRNA(Gln) amidotransferase subunit B